MACWPELGDYSTLQPRLWRACGYKPRLSHMEAASGFPGGAGGVRVLDDIELFEVSIVTFPAQPLATVTGVKSANDAWLESLISDMAYTVSRHGGMQKGRETMTNSKGMVGKLYANRHYSLQRAAKEMGVPETALQAWVEADERVNGTAKSMRGTGYVYPAWELAQIVQAHAYDVPLVGAVSGKATDLGYRLEYGRPEESRKEFERELRRELREEDDLYQLGDKSRQKEIERRQKERTAKQLADRDALVAERKAAEKRHQALMQESFTPGSFSQATGIDEVWCTRWFNAYIMSGLVEPVDAATLTLKSEDVRRMATKDAEMIEGQCIRAAHRRAEGRAA